MQPDERQLPIPEPASHDGRARELARIWATGGEQHVSLATELWEDPAAWGIMLVDLAKHVANAYEHNRGDDRQSVLKRLKMGFDAEWDFETDKPTGRLMD